MLMLRPIFGGVAISEQRTPRHFRKIVWYPATQSAFKLVVGTRGQRLTDGRALVLADLALTDRINPDEIAVLFSRWDTHGPRPLAAEDEALLEKP